MHVNGSHVSSLIDGIHRLLKSFLVSMQNPLLLVLVIHSFSLFSFPPRLHLIIEILFVFLLGLSMQCMLLFGLKPMSFNIIECQNIIHIQKTRGTSSCCRWKRRSLSANSIHGWIHVGVSDGLIFSLGWFILMKWFVFCKLSLSVRLI